MMDVGGTTMAVDNFSAFVKTVAASFQDLAKGANVFVVELEDGLLYKEYLGAFPAGSNPAFKTTTEHDCRSCWHFIRRAGNVVVVADDGMLRTVWDVAAKEAVGPYREVAARLRDVVRAAGVRDLFRVGENDTGFGAPQSRVMDKETQQVRTWSHLHTGEIPRHLRSATCDQLKGDYRTTVQVFARGLTELSVDAVETVISLIEANALYRGDEHKRAVVEFRKAQRAFLSRPEGRDRDVFAWAHADSPAARFRNTVIGTLVQDLSAGVPVEQAVTSFETKVAPQNYKRTTAIITPGMVKAAMTTIESLGLEPALERRFATISDISVKDVLWVDGTVKPLMKGGLADALMKHVSSGRSPEGDVERAEEIGLDDFVARILPETTSLELLFKGAQLGNLMSLTAPVHPEPKQLFRWKNDFAWSYVGNVADSIKERVKKAGGKVDGAVLRVSLSWYNYDDLDLHVREPEGRNVRGLHEHIFFGNKKGWTGGCLDVDMNAGRGETREAVENVVWSKTPPDGVYTVWVNNYTHRESSNPGFVIEVESGGKLSHFSFNKGVRQKQDIAVVNLHVKNGVVEKFEIGDAAITASNISQEKWGLKTEQYVKVSTVTLSPNFWAGAGAVGNKHTFFILENAKNDESTRGFYNEYLHPRLEAHRKVFEVIGDKTKCAPSENQLSGLGFSSTVKTSFIVRARQGKKQRVFNVQV
jgi:hypothetical protein